MSKIVNAHAAARGITEVIFKSLSTKETNKNNEITATLEFCECPKITVVKKKATTSSKGTAKATTKSSNNTTSQDTSSFIGPTRLQVSSAFSKEQANQIRKLHKTQQFLPKISG